MLHPHIRTFSFHYREKYGHAVGKIPIDIGQSCPNRENGGCIFCRPASFTPAYLRKNDAVPEQIARGKKYLLKNRFRKYFAYFQQETTTALPARQLMPVFSLLLHDPDCVGLILSTRPDYVDQQLLEQLAGLVRVSGKECVFELGLQSVHDSSLALLNRNHNFVDFSDAVQRILATGVLEVGAHLIFGIPGESEQDMLASIRTVCALGIHALKFHHLQVIRDTTLHDMYIDGQISLFSQEEYLQFLLTALPIIPVNITIHRLWATSHPELLVAPKWNTLASGLSRMLQGKMEEKGLWQGQTPCV